MKIRYGSWFLNHWVRACGALLIALVSFMRAEAVTIYVDNAPTMTGDCPDGKYSINIRDCSGTDGVAYDSLEDVTGFWRNGNQWEPPVTTVSPGDTIIIREGIYTRPKTNSGVPAFTIRTSGEPNRPIIFESHENEVAIISGNNEVRSALTVEADHIHIKRLHFTAGRTFGLEISGAHDIYVTGIHAYKNGGQSGAVVGINAHSDSSNVVIDRVRSYDNGLNLAGGESGNGIGLGRDPGGSAPNPGSYSLCTDCTIQNSFIYNNHWVGNGTNSADGLLLQGALRATVRNNVVYGNNDDGIDALGCIACQIDGNVVLSNGGAYGIKMNVGGGGANVISNNIAVLNRVDGITTGRGVGNVYVNNTTYANRGVGISLDGGSFHNIVFNNIMYGNSPAGGGNTHEYFSCPEVHRACMMYSDDNLIGDDGDLANVREYGFDGSSFNADPKFAYPQLNFDSAPLVFPNARDANEDGILSPEEWFHDRDADGVVTATEVVAYFRDHLIPTATSPAVDEARTTEFLADLISANLNAMKATARNQRDSYLSNPGQTRRYYNYWRLMDYLDAGDFSRWTGIPPNDAWGGAAYDGDGDGASKRDLGAFEFGASAPEPPPPPPTGGFVLAVSKTGHGTVASTPPGIQCGDDCLESYIAGTAVTLTASPNFGYRFSGWSGDCSGKNLTCVVTMNSNKSVTANFGSSGPAGESIETGVRIINPLVRKSNTASPDAVFTVGLETADRLSITIYDRRGEKIQTLADEDHGPGSHSFSWDGRNATGEFVASGIYSILVQIGSHKIRKTLVVLK